MDFGGGKHTPNKVVHHNTGLIRGMLQYGYKLRSLISRLCLYWLSDWMPVREILIYRYINKFTFAFSARFI